MILVRAEPDTEVLGAAINGRQVAHEANTWRIPGDRWRMIYAAPPKEGFELMLQIRQSEPLTLTVEDVSYELPTIPGAPPKPRGDYMMPAPLFGASDSTLVSKAFVLGNQTK